MWVHVGTCGYKCGLDMWVQVGRYRYMCGINKGTSGLMWNVGTCVANCRHVGTCDDVSGHL